MCSWPQAVEEVMGGQEVLYIVCTGEGPGELLLP